MSSGAETRVADRGDDWRRAERVTLRVLALYQEAVGALDGLFAAIQVTPPPEGMSLVSHVGSLPVPQLARLTGRAVAELAARDSRRAGRPVLRPCDWRVILYSLSGARTLRDAIARCIDCFEAIDWRCGRMAFAIAGDAAEVSLDAMRPPGEPEAGCLIDLFALTHVHGLLDWLIGRPIPIRYVALDHDESLLAALDLPSLPFATRFRAGRNSFVFDAKLLEHPVVRTADELASRPPNSLLFGSGVPEEGGVSPDAAEQVRRMALRSLGERQHLPAFEELVANIGGSAATLRRRLAREGTSYRQIRESCRREVAFDLLRRTNLSIEAVAGRLDYCDSDAFRQDFRGWTGTSPSAYRRTMRAST